MSEIRVTIEQAHDLVLDVLKAKRVPSLTSSPGVGKSALARQLARENNLQLIDIRLSQVDPTDLNGFPGLKKSNNSLLETKGTYHPMDVFPLVGDEIPEGKQGWLVLLDEFNSAPRAVQAAAYKVVLDKMVGAHEIHPKTAIMTAGNLKTDKAIVNEIGTAMQSRVIHFEIMVCDKVFGRWADANGVDHRVKSFIRFKPSALHKFDPNHNEKTFPCPRTWEFVSDVIKPYQELKIEKLALLAGCIGEGMGREFFSYTKIFGELPQMSEILRAPESVRLGDEPSVHYALTGLIAHHMTVENAEPLMKFINRLAIDFQVITLRSAIVKIPDIKKSKPVKDWITRNAKELVKN